ncbi:MAG TPA: hypothetical protein VFP80_05960, partial [Thermoanaerobaculia bacterium]|nr:hypothetical protein [Thermoanaerobaculia bacterium]
LALFFACGLCALAFTWVTVHRRPEAQFAASTGSMILRTEMLQWERHGYLASYGLLAPTEDPHLLYRSWPGDFMLTTWAVVALGGFDWQALALHNLLISLAVSALLALLAYRLALRMGVDPLHALALGVGVEMAHFTFPENLAIYWGMTAQTLWLAAAVPFLLIEERAADGRTRRMNVAQAVLVFAMVRLQYVYALMFLAVYVLAVFLLRGERPPLRRVLLAIFAPAAVALAIFAGQLLLAKYDPEVKLFGSRFLYRTGLDGDAELYGDHLDIAFGRDFIRAQRPGNRQYFFRWPVLFVSGVLATLAAFVAYLRGRVPQTAIVALVTLLGAYAVHAAVFSQLVALHPYFFDPVLVPPLILALFGIAPALAEVHTGRTGFLTVATFLAAVWVAFFQIRVYALCYPL